MGMMDLDRFVGPIKTTPPMRVEVIDIKGKVINVFEAPPGFQLERYVDALYPNHEFMVYATDTEVNISVVDDDQITEVFKGTYV